MAINAPKEAGSISASTPTPVISVSPVVLSAPGRGEELRVRVSAPATGQQLPVIVFAHGFGSSSDGYAPLANFWAAHGFVVIQPTHLSSKTLGDDPGVDPDGPEGPMFWRSRAEDMRRVLDGLDAIEAAVPELGGRLDRGRVAVAGHSMGGHTASMLLGMRVTDPYDGTEVDVAEPRIKAGVLLATVGNGNGGADLSALAAEHYPFLSNNSFAGMTTPALVVAGDKDTSAHLTVRGEEWHADPYFLSNGPKCLLTLFGAEHGLGGVSGYDVAETTDEDPERVAAVQMLTWAYLRTELYPEDRAWDTARIALEEMDDPPGRVECK